MTAASVALPGVGSKAAAARGCRCLGNELTRALEEGAGPQEVGKRAVEVPERDVVEDRAPS
jgi:hypothetical protein